MTIARGTAFGALIAAVIVVAYVMLGSGGSTLYVFEFQSAGQLVKGNPIKIGGTPSGQIKDIELSGDNQARLTVEIDDKFAPLHEGTQATIRLTSLSGVANRYIAVSPGPNNMPEIDEGGTIGTDATTTAVDLDQLFNALDPDTLKGLQGLIQGFGVWYAGRASDVSQSLKYFAPALASFTAVEKQLLADQETFTKLIVEGSRALGAIASRRDDLADLVSNANATTRAIGSENVSLAQALEFLPSTLNSGSDAFVKLRSTINDLDTLIDATRENLPGLAPFLNDLAKLAGEARPAIRDFRYIVNTPGRHNDVTDLTAQAPKLASTAKTSVGNTVKALRKADPVIRFIRPYAPEIAAWLTKWGQASANYDANGHYARVVPLVNAYSYDQGTNTLTPVAPSGREALVGPYKNAIKRCPGSGTQGAADGSSPFTDAGKLDCDPTLVPPGP